LKLLNSANRDQLIEWRRSQVLELSSKGYSQSEIVKKLEINKSTISKDVTYLREQSKQNIKKYFDERLPEEYEKCLVGITSILKEAWNTANSQEGNGKDKLHALSLAKDCYSMKLELLTNPTIVEDALKFVHRNKDNNKQELSSNKVQNSDAIPLTNNSIDTF
jgi:predicted transcriptional regulator